MFRRCTLSVALLAVFCLVAQRPASAQTGGLSGTGSTRSAGTAGTGNTAGSASTLSAAQGYGLDSRYTGSGFDRFTSGSASMGQTTAGAGAATSGAFGQSSTGQSQMGGQQSRFGNLGNMGGYGSMGYGGMGGMMGMRNMMGMGSQQTTQQQGKVRTHMRLGFDVPPQPATTVNTRFSGVVTRVLERKDVGGGRVTVLMEGSTAVLSGTVATEHARDVIERLAMLEPGIADVRNELLVNPAEPTRETEPKSNSGDRPR